MKEAKQEANTLMSFEQFKLSVVDDYRIANISRQASLLGRREVLTGKAKFGIFGDGKEVAQIAMAKVFKHGDFRSGYYRDQTFMFAAGLLTVQQYFAQLYADTDTDADPCSQGRLMNGHFATKLLDEKGDWLNLTQLKNSSADISPTAGQMPRLLGLAYASKLYRNNNDLNNVDFSKFSINGNEVAFGTIGDASTSEGLFWETMNAAGVLQVPLAMSVWDDGYGISVSKKYQTIKQSISEALSGFATTGDKDGFLIYTAKGWDYPTLCSVYKEGINFCRKNHMPVLFHITDVTQPQGHSTSGSHERYKSKERLDWENDHDCIAKMREFILENGISTEDVLQQIEKEAKQHVNESKKRAWDEFCTSINNDRISAVAVLNKVKENTSQKVFVEKIIADLNDTNELDRKAIITAVKKCLRLTINDKSDERKSLVQWMQAFEQNMHNRYESHLYSETENNALKIKSIAPVYSDNAVMMDGREILQANFDALLNMYPEMLAFGEDVGKIGGVNQTYAGLQQKYGELRVQDTGIREATIIGQGIGLALRGLRPIAEIQYLDYLAYAINVLTDDLACLSYRTKGFQKAPLIVSSRGHRLEGVWHSGSPMQFILGALRGMYILVPRDMTTAAGFYNTLMKSDNPALIIECLNGYRLKEKMPSNLGEFCLPLGIPEVLMDGDDVTIVTYGSCIRVAMDSQKQLSEMGISVELIDVQTLIPFDINHLICKSLQKTNRIIFVDEDVEGGATAYMMQQVLEVQNGYQFLDASPLTVSANDHRPAYGSDGDYFSKSNAEKITEAVYSLMHQSNPAQYPKLY
ncbi:MAG TPA: thiamine pyrophosphate-dependent enzyme [Bacteroidia bacterium]|nr:thiamine pyrophosphate-dependent enzyme [Bacteroidia bacterium]